MSLAVECRNKKNLLLFVCVLKEFKFSNIDLKTLLTKTIDISVWDKDFGKNDFIGMIKNLVD